MSIKIHLLPGEKKLVTVPHYVNVVAESFHLLRDCGPIRVLDLTHLVLYLVESAEFLADDEELVVRSGV